MLDTSSASETITLGKVKSGILWIAGITAFRDGLQFLITLVLVRIVSPSAYGQFSLVTAFVGFFTILSFRSFLEYTMQVRPGETVDYDVHFTIGGVFQGVALVALNVVAFVLSRSHKYSSVAPLLSVMSAVFLLDWVGELRVKMLERSLNWRRLRFLEGAGMLLNAGAAILLALAGAGVFALLIPGLLITVPFFVDLFWMQRWRPRWIWDWRKFNPAWRYGITRVGSGLVIRGQQLLEGSCLVAAIGFASLGIYGRAAGLASICCLRLPSVLTLTLFPMLTRLEPGSAEMRHASALVFRSVAWISLPAAVFVGILSEPLVRLLYGIGWLGAVPILPWVLAVAAIASLSDTCNFLLLANLNQRRSFALDILRLLGAGFALLLLLPKGLTVYLAGMVGVQLALWAIAVTWLCRLDLLTWAGIRSALAYPLIAIPTAISATFLFLRLAPRGISPILSVFLTGALLGVLYILPLRWFATRELLELVHYVPGSVRLRTLLRLEPA